MELKNGPVSPFRLIWLSFRAANQSFGSVVAAAIWLALFQLLILGVIYLSRFISPILPVILLVVFYFLSSFLSLVFLSAIIKIIAAKIEKTGMTAAESLTSSLVPSAYLIVSSIILAIPCVALVFGASMSGSALMMGIVQLVLYLAMLPFIFVQHTLVLREEGPISALKYSWEIGSTFYVRILITLLGFVAVFIFVALAVICAVKALHPEWITGFLSMAHLPQAARTLYISNLFHSVSPTILVVGAILLIFLYGFIFLSIQALLTALFLNLDYSLRGGYNREADGVMLEIPPAVASVEKTPLQEPAPVVSEVQVKQSSIRTESVDENTFHHLEQVYSAQEHLDRAIEQEEDRMPTILFDEDMLKQLAESEKQMRLRQEKAEKKQEEDGQSIKMSDKPLL